MVQPALAVPDFPPLAIVTAANLDVTAELRPGVEHYRRCCLPVLARALAAIRYRLRPPCLLIHGPGGSAKSLLAMAMVREGRGVWCLDCLASAFHCRSNLPLDSIALAGCALFIIDDIGFISGHELQAFYRRCLMHGAVLVLLSEDRATLRHIGFRLPERAAVFRLSCAPSLVADDEHRLPTAGGMSC